MGITRILLALLIFGIIIMIHEFGHFFVAKLNKVLVHEFSIGMGPCIFSKKIGDTQYSIRALPIGGYVRMEGEDEDSDNTNSLNNKSPLARFSIIVAGAVMNILLTILIFFILFSTTGVQTTTIAGLVDGSPALQSGIRPGDKIIAVDNIIINRFDQISPAVKESKGRTCKIKIVRNGNSQFIEVKPTKDKKLGIIPKKDKNIYKAFSYSVLITWKTAGDMLVFIKDLITGGVGLNNVSGPIGVITQVGRASKYGFGNLMFLVAFISLNLGIINLLPIPALDGGRLLMIILEMISGRKPDPKKEGHLHFIGMIFILFLMLLVTYKDILRLIRR